MKTHTYDMTTDDKLDLILQESMTIVVEPLKGVEIMFGHDARNASWYCYVSLPKRITERPVGYWMGGPDSNGGYWWSRCNAPTRQEAMEKALTECLGPMLALLMGPFVLLAGKKITL